jgi:hypothetical protein
MPRKNRQSPIRSIYYDEASGTLHVAFSDGTDYTYNGVPSDVAAEFKDAGSQGAYFNANIRGVYG